MTKKAISTAHQQTVTFQKTIYLSSITLDPGTWIQVRIPLPKVTPDAEQTYGIIEISCLDNQPHIYRTKDVPDLEWFCDHPNAIPAFDCEEGQVRKKETQS